MASKNAFEILKERYSKSEDSSSEEPNALELLRRRYGGKPKATSGSKRSFGGLGPMGSFDLFTAYPQEAGKMFGPFAGFVKEEGPVEAGAEAMSQIGMVLGAPFGPVGIGVGERLGEGIGGAVVRNVQQSIKERRGEVPKMSPWGRTKLTARSMAEEMIPGEMGRGAFKVLGHAMAPGAKSMMKEGDVLARLARQYGSHLTPGQLLDSWVADTTETIADAAFFGGRRMKKLKLRGQTQMLENFADDIGEMFSRRAATMDPDTIGKLVDDVIGKNNKVFMQQAKALYKNVDELTEGVPVDISELKSFANALTKETKQLQGIGASEAGESLLMKISNLDDKVNFSLAQELRSRLMTEERFLAANRDKARGVAKKLVKLTDNAIARAGKDLSPDALSAFRIANRFYKAGKEKYANKIIRRLIQTVQDRGEPEKIIPYIFQPRSVSKVKKVKRALGPGSPAWHSLKAKYVESILTPSPGRALGSNIPREFKKMGDDMLSEIFSKSERTALNQLGKMSELVTGKASREMATGGSMVVQLVQGGAILSVLSGRFGEIATPVFIGPEIISQLATRPTTAKWLTEGLGTPAGTPHAYGLASRLMSSVVRHKRKQDKQQSQQSMLQNMGAINVGGM